ncbi:MAG: protein-L-isoaspartate(D-aspartate) O-methyltransferase [Calditrichota bacterium]|jgi:protein-L-isoaspartate(D-aspartate) O-methyltransferase
MVFTNRRNEMIRKFVLGAGITDERVVNAMSKVPRHLFVEPAISHRAYEGTSLPIGFGQTISHPTTVALMSAALRLEGSEKVLEIGTGSGYQAAVLAEIGVRVFTIERIPELAQRAQHLFEELNYFTIAAKIGDGSPGWVKFAPFQRILLTAHSSEIPPSLVDQLDENGILLMPVGDKDKQNLVKLTKTNGKFLQETISTVNFVPMIYKT